MISLSLCGLDEKTQTSLTALFKSSAKIQSVHLFGSRAKGTFKPGSDIDLVVTSPEMTHKELLQLETKLDDLLLPFKVDLLLLHEIENTRLMEHIERVKKLLYECGKNLPLK